MRVDSRFSVLIINGDFELPSNLGIWWHCIATLLGTNISPYPIQRQLGRWVSCFPFGGICDRSLEGMFSLEPQNNLSCLIACIVFAWVMVFHHVWQVSHSFSKRPVLQTGWLWWTHQSGYRMWEKMGWGFIPFVWKKNENDMKLCHTLLCFWSTFIVHFWFSKFRMRRL